MWYTSKLCDAFNKLWERKRVLESWLAALHHKYGKNTLTQEMIEPCRELATTLHMLDMEDDAISIVELHLNMHRVDFGFNPEKYSNYTFDFNPKLVREIEDLLEHAARLRERCIESLPLATGKTEPRLNGISELIMYLGILYTNRENYETGLSMGVRSLQIRRAIFGRVEVNDYLVNSLHVIGYSHWVSGNLNDATGIIEQALELCLTAPENDDSTINTARSLFILGEIHKDQGNLMKAVLLHEQGLNLLRISSAQDVIPNVISDQLDRLGNTYMAQGKDGEVAKIHKEANEIRRNLEKCIE